MSTIVLAEIYGLTPEFLTFCRRLPGKILPLSPYQDDSQSFENEVEAYEYFTTHVGLESYSDKLAAEINKEIETNRSDNLSLIGFSVGASAIWQCGIKFPTLPISRAVLFYGSQIRHMTENAPDWPCKVILPSAEAHFNVELLAVTIEQLALNHIQIVRSDYLHGFMNKRSKNYSSKGYDRYVGKLSKLLTECE